MNRGLGFRVLGLRELHYVLVMLCREGALDKLQNSGQNDKVLIL